MLAVIHRDTREPKGKPLNKIQAIDNIQANLFLLSLSDLPNLF